jgi:hypothetical protein
MLQAAGSKIAPKKIPPAKPETVAKSWTRIDQWLEQYAPKWKPLKKAATSEQIQVTESKLGLKLSTDLRASYLVHSRRRAGTIYESEMPKAAYVLELETQDGNGWEQPFYTAAWRRGNKKSPIAFLQTGFVVVIKTGNTYFRTGGHYHRLRKLNYCVRDGNRWAFRIWSPGENHAGGSHA